jgi:hypothetical protein
MNKPDTEKADDLSSTAFSIDKKASKPYNGFGKNDENLVLETLTLRLRGVFCDFKDASTADDRERSKKYYFVARCLGTVLDYLDGHGESGGAEN